MYGIPALATSVMIETWPGQSITVVDGVTARAHAIINEDFVLMLQIPDFLLWDYNILVRVIQGIF